MKKTYNEPILNFVILKESDIVTESINVCQLIKPGDTVIEF